MSTAVDCLGKLISHQYFLDPPKPVANPDSIVPAMRADAPTQPLMHRVVDTITKAFEGDVTDVRVQLQIMKALLTTVLNDGDDRTMVHGSALLKCVRGVYNISLLGRAEGGIQTMAQGMLMQMVNTLFRRIITRPRGSSSVTLDRDTADIEPNAEDPQQITLYHPVLVPTNRQGIHSRLELAPKNPEGPRPIKVMMMMNMMNKPSPSWTRSWCSERSANSAQKIFQLKG